MSNTKESLDVFRKSVAFEHVLFWEYQNHRTGSTDGLDLETTVRRYKTNYWDVVHGDHIPQGLALCMLDFGVVSGTDEAVRALQTALVSIGQTVDGGVDGKFGPATISALSEVVDEPKKTLDLLKWYTAYRNMFHAQNKPRKGTVAENQCRAADALVKATMQTLLEM